MKTKDLTDEQLSLIAKENPEWITVTNPIWMGRNRPHLMSKYRMDWMIKNRPEWMDACCPRLMFEHRNNLMFKHHPEWFVKYFSGLSKKYRELKEPSTEDIPGEIMQLLEKK